MESDIHVPVGILTPADWKDTLKPTVFIEYTFGVATRGKPYLKSD